MAWLSIVMPLIVFAAVVVIPGILIAYSAGLRRVYALGLAPAFSLTIIGVAAIIAPIMHLSWGLIPVAITTIALAVIIFFVRLALVRVNPRIVAVEDPTKSALGWSIGLTIAFVVIAFRVISMIQLPTNISQTYDDVFHLNAVRYILDTGNASSLTIAGLKSGGGFYPAVWHGLTSLVAIVSGAGIPTAINTVSVGLSAIVWPLGALFFTAVVFGVRRRTAIIAGILSAAFAGFPYLMLDFGVLFAFALALAILLPTWALLISAFGEARGPRIGKRMSLLLMALILPGLMLVHPTIAIGMLVLAVPLGATLVVRRWLQLRQAGAPRRQYIYVIIWVFVTITIIGGIIRKFMPGNMWHPKVTVPQAFGEVALFGPENLSAAYGLAVFAVIGIVVLVRKRDQTFLLVTFGLYVFLYIIARAVWSGILRNVFVGLWFGDPYRLVALLAIISLPIGLIGAEWVLDRLHALGLRKFSKTVAAWTLPVSMLLLLGVTQYSNISLEVRNGQKNYALTPTSPLLTTDEYALLMKVDQYVPEGVTVAGSPWTGTSLVFGLANRPALIAHMKYDNAETDLISQDLAYAAEIPEVCQAVRKLNVGFVLDFGTQEVLGERHYYAGFENLETNPSVTKVTSVGAASLWKITACS